MKPAILAFVSVAYGLIAARLFRRFVHLGGASNRIIAHMLEFHLFIDEPALVLRAQRDLLRENLMVLRQVAIPGAMLGILLAMAFPAMDSYFGHGPVQAGQSLVAEAPEPVAFPKGIVVETPPVHVPRLHRVAWRIHTTPDFAGGFPSGVSVSYPRSGIFGLHWLVWFTLLSSVAALPPRLLPRLFYVPAS